MAMKALFTKLDDMQKHTDKKIEKATAQMEKRMEKAMRERIDELEKSLLISVRQTRNFPKTSKTHTHTNLHHTAILHILCNKRASSHLFASQTCVTTPTD